MIRYLDAERAQLPQMAALWSSVFGDTPAYVQNFYAYWYGRAHCLAAMDGEKLAGMLYMLPNTLLIGGKPQKCLYLYAGSVDPEYRQRGIFGEMMRYAVSLCSRTQMYAVGIPVNDKLFDFYTKIGFNLVPLYSKVSIQPDALPAPPESAVRELTGEAYALAAAQRNSLLPCAVQWDVPAAGYALSEVRSCGGFAKQIVLAGQSCAAVGCLRENVLHIFDLTAPPAMRDAVLAALVQQFPCTLIRCRIPSQKPDTDRRCIVYSEQPVQIPSCYFPLDLL